MPVPRMTTRRWMVVVAFVAFLSWGGMACHQRIRGVAPVPSVDPFDAPELLPSGADDRL
jgi:hypothetical protein